MSESPVPDRIPEHDVKLILAYVGYYNNDPKCLNDLITGSCVWPPDDSLEVLVRRAWSQIEDINELRGMNRADGAGPKLCQLYAATVVLERKIAGTVVIDIKTRSPFAPPLHTNP